jgi:kynurenine formamidase
MKPVDLTRLLDPADLDRMPERLRRSAVNIVPSIDRVRPDGEGADVMCQIFGCTRDDLPGGEGWGDDRMNVITVHLGTHVDAPLHYGSTCEGKPARTIDQIQLDELVVDGVVLDVRDHAKPGEGIPVDALREAVDRAGGIPPGGAAMLRTGQERYTLADRELYNYPGMTREGTLLLADLGARVLGTDALGWDRPFGVMRRAFRETGNPAEIWDGHFAGREREVFIVQQLANLGALPPGKVRVGFFPLRLAGCSAAPARVVAFVDH